MGRTPIFASRTQAADRQAGRQTNRTLDSRPSAPSLCVCVIRSFVKRPTLALVTKHSRFYVGLRSSDRHACARVTGREGLCCRFVSCCQHRYLEECEAVDTFGSFGMKGPNEHDDCDCVLWHSFDSLHRQQAISTHIACHVCAASCSVAIQSWSYYETKHRTFHAST